MIPEKKKLHLLLLLATFFLSVASSLVFSQGLSHGEKDVEERLVLARQKADQKTINDFAKLKLNKAKEDLRLILERDKEIEEGIKKNIEKEIKKRIEREKKRIELEKKIWGPSNLFKPSTKLELKSRTNLESDDERIKEWRKSIWKSPELPRGVASAPSVNVSGGNAAGFNFDKASERMKLFSKKVYEGIKPFTQKAKSFFKDRYADAKKVGFVPLTLIPPSRWDRAKTWWTDAYGRTGLQNYVPASAAGLGLLAGGAGLGAWGAYRLGKNYLQQRELDRLAVEKEAADDDEDFLRGGE